MENEDQGLNDYSHVVDTLISMFGNVLSKDVIVAVVESCGGDLNYSVNAVMSITSDDVDSTKEGLDEDRGTSDLTNQTALSPVMSYSGVSQRAGTIPKQYKAVQPTINSSMNIWTDQLRQIITYHNQGSRILIILRGVPGSGKSYLAKKIVEMTIGSTFVDYQTHICSTDDYFMHRGQYQYDKSRLQDAHSWNQNRVRAAVMQGLSPIIIDNTNIEIWETEPYVRDGVRNGYIIEVVEPNTPWAKKLNQLVRRNSHNVPIHTIKRMLDNYQNGITGFFLLKYFNLSYPQNMTPPVLRTIPAVLTEVSNLSFTSDNGTGNKESYNSDDLLAKENGSNDTTNMITKSDFHTWQKLCINDSNDDIRPSTSTTNDQTTNCALNISTINKNSTTSTKSNKNISDSGDILQNPSTENQDETSLILNENSVNKAGINEGNFTEKSNHKDDSALMAQEEKENVKKYIEIQKHLEEIEKVEQEWENGETWGDDLQTGISCSDTRKNTIDFEPKPPRNNTMENSTADEKLLASVKECPDWRQISLFMPQWENSFSLFENNIPEINVETNCSSTCMEIGDTDVYNTKNKVISAVPRNINQYCMGLSSGKIPEKQMLDKSTMTNEYSAIEAFRCKNEEKHFVAFRKLFKNVEKAALRDIFDKCCGDVNWAVDIVLDGMANKQLEITEDEVLSDMEDSDQKQCECLAIYNIIPDIATTTSGTLTNNVIYKQNKLENAEATPHIRRTRKDKGFSELSLHLKQQIEQNVVIADNHYSEHCLKIKKIRYGEYSEREHITSSDMLEDNQVTSELLCLPSTSKGKSASYLYTDQSDDEDSNSSVDIEKTVNISLGREFVSQLDELFGRKDLAYPENIVPRINIPLSLLNEINALWMESLMYQLDEQAKQSAVMLQQDEEFARQLALKEAELAQEGKEPEVPDFKEIMDMDFALSLYQKDVEEWRNNEPNDLAAKLSREKLYNLFPEISPATLSELLMAHDNNFQSTVEALLVSTGKSEILEQKNGISKFVMEKEMERQEKILEEQKKALSEVEWPLLPKGEKVEMRTVDNYREEAEKHLANRNLSYQKAQDYIRRGMTQVANYYSDVASYHKQKYEQANSLAAASLMQIHATNCPDNATVDLHYLRVAEAKETLDLFLDTHIQKLRESQSKGGLKCHTLFFITGRGLHSSGGPRVKPAVKRRLRERGISYSERNPGLLTAKVCADDKLTYQVP